MLSQYMTSWKRYVDDTISYVKVDCIEHVLTTWTSFNANIFFTYALREKCPYSELFWSVFSRIRTEKPVYQNATNK